MARKLRSVRFTGSFALRHRGSPRRIGCAWLLPLSLGLAGPGLAWHAPASAAPSPETVHAKVAIGSPTALLSGLPQSPTRTARTPSTYTFYSPAKQPIDVKIDVYHFMNGELGMSGDPKVSGSDFILKGNSTSIYGWVVLRDEGRAFEYTTGTDGLVYVQEVPITKIYQVCPEAEVGTHETGRVPARHPHAEGPLNERAAEDHIKPYNGQDLFKLQSLPGSTKVLWLDISDVMEGDTPRFYSKEQLYQAWQIFASSYSMFDVNVTTDESVYRAAGTTNGGINHLDAQEGRSFCPINAFGTGRQCETQLQTAQEYPNQYGKTMAHETGHLMGLQHDGDSRSDYFGGFPDYQWSPTMGNNRCCKSWDVAIAHWSKGEYNEATNKQDDLAVITRNLPYREDDIQESRALEISNGTIDPTVAANRGQINGEGDTDTFSFSLQTGGLVKLTVQPTEILHGSALDVEASIVDESGNKVATVNETKVRKAEFSEELPAGTYHLVIAGGGEGTPEKGFSSYATMGFYAISGTLPYDSDPPEVEITSPKDGSEISTSTDSAEVSIVAEAADGMGSGVSQVSLEIDGKLLAGSEDLEAPYSWTVPLDVGRHSVIAVATDGIGNEGRSSAVAIVIVEESGSEGEEGSDDDDDDDDDDDNDGDDDDDDDDGGDGDDDDDDDDDSDSKSGETDAADDPGDKKNAPGCACSAGGSSHMGSLQLALASWFAVFGLMWWSRRRT